ncbi:MAG: hypothetical protein HYY04_09355 [Chloroflexi bacterium]|nr:hypothetical protein [Chloroflexota bacterium]
MDADGPGVGPDPGAALELAICAFAQDEGLGSVYERVVLRRFLARLAEELRLRSVLEYGCAITRGYDNLAWLDRCDVTVYDPDIARIRAAWRPDRQPRLVDHVGGKTNGDVDGKHDLVWNFAQIQTRPELLAELLPSAGRYVLVFTPNILNWGTPFHLAYHALTRVECRHAERGRLALRTRAGLAAYVRSHRLRVLRTGYIDMPYLPDIGFSIRELKQVLGRGTPESEAAPQPSAAVLRKVEWLMGWERRALPDPVQAVLAHHCWVLAQVDSLGVDHVR